MMAPMLTMRFVAFLAIACSAGGCTNTPKSLEPKPAEMLSGTVWQLGKLGDRVVQQDTQPTLQFTPNGQVSGSGSCNRFSGTATIAGETISFGPLASTRMACAEAINAQEAEYFKALGGAQRFVVQGNSLQIYTSAMDQPLLFVRAN